MNIKTDLKKPDLEIRCPLCGAVYTECSCSNRCSCIEIEGTILKKARVSSSKFVVPEHITVIAEKAFYWNEEIETITLPTSIIEIGKEAFADCCNLEYINLHKLINLTTIGDHAFSFCRKLKLDEISFYSLLKLKNIGNSAFMETGIESVSFVSVENVGICAFANCSELKRAFFFRCNTNFDEDIFADCSRLEEVALPENMTEIPNGMFNNCVRLREIHIPKRVTKIGDYAFKGCKSLTDVSVMGELNIIGNSSFAYCDSLGRDFEFELLSWDALKYIEKAAFSGCSNLTHVEIPAGVIYIGPNAFSYCENIRYMFVPKSVMTVGKNAFPDHPFGIKFDIELPYQPRDWDVELNNDQYLGVTVNWGYIPK